MADLSFDVLIVGGGQAGIPLAWALAKAGRKVALAERKYLGGSCVNFGCTPTKAALASAKLAHQARRGAEYGLRIPVVEADFPAVIRRAGEIAMESRRSLDKGLENSENPRLLRGHARFVGRDAGGFRLRAGDCGVTAAEVVVNTGTRSAIPKIPGLEKIDFLHAGNWLGHRELPERLAVIGGGYIGLEMAQFYRRMGSDVAVWEGGPRLAEHEDEDVSSALREFLEREGIRFHLNARIESLEQFEGASVFVAAGRQPNSGDLGLETVGARLDERGYMGVDGRLASNVAGIWAAGDIRGGPQFTHTAWDDFRILESQMAGDGARTTDRIVPYAVFTDPELGRVGLTKREAASRGLRYAVKRFEMKRNGKARELGESGGFIEVLLEEGTDRILGAALLCSAAAELAHLYVDLMNAGAPAAAIRNAIHIHPTLAEAAQSALG